MAMMPKSLRLTEMIRMYSVDPVPIARSLRESMRLNDHIQAITSSAEKNQYDTALSRESARIDTSSLPRPNQAICVPKTTTIRMPRSLSHRRRAYLARQSSPARGAPKPRPTHAAHRRSTRQHAPRAPVLYLSAASSPH